MYLCIDTYTHTHYVSSINLKRAIQLLVSYIGEKKSHKTTKRGAFPGMTWRGSSSRAEWGGRAHRLIPGDRAPEGCLKAGKGVEQGIAGISAHAGTEVNTAANRDSARVAVGPTQSRNTPRSAQLGVAPALGDTGPPPWSQGSVLSCRGCARTLGCCGVVQVSGDLCSRLASLLQLAWS